MKIKLLLYAFAVLLASFGIQMMFNPSRVEFWSQGHGIGESPSYIEPWVLRKISLDKVEKANVFRQLDYSYRYGMQRTGFVDLEMSTSLSPRLIVEDVNHGIHSASKASPILLDDYILIATDTGILKKIDRVTGAELWRLRSLDASNGFHSTPVLYGSKIVVGDYAGRLYALDSASGEVLWVLALGHAIGATPLIHDGKIFVSVETNEPNGFVAKIDLESGKIDWLSPWLGEQGHSSPALDENAGVLIVGDNSGMVSAIELSNGKFRWRTPTGGPLKGTAAIGNGNAFVGSWDGYVYALEIKTGEIRWKSFDRSMVQSSLALLPDGSFGYVNGEEGLCKIDLSTGERKICTGEKMGRDAETSSPVLSRRAGYLGEYLVWSPCGQTDLCVYHFDSLKQLARWNFGSAISGEVRLDRGRAYFVTNSGPGLYELSRFETN